MKKLFTLLMSLMAFSALFAQYQKPNDNRYYNDRNANYNGGNYSANNGNYISQQDARMHDDGALQSYGRKNDFDRRRDEGSRIDNFHRDPNYGYPDRYHDRDDWRRNRHRGLGLLGTGLVIGGVIGAVIASH